MILSERLRQKFSEQLRSLGGNLEEYQNKNFNLSLGEQLHNHSLSYMQEQFKLLFKSIENISFDRKKGEMVNMEMYKLQ